MIDELAEPEYDESGDHPEAYARWLRTLSHDTFQQEQTERWSDWMSCPADQDDSNYEVRHKACQAEETRRGYFPNIHTTTS